MSAIATELRSYTPPHPFPSVSSVHISVWRRGAALLGGLSLATGLTGLASWLVKMPDLRTFGGGGAEMKANAAVALILASTAVVIEASGNLRRRAHHIEVVCGIAVATIGLATLAEWITGLDLGIDQLAFRDVASIGTPAPGRFAPGTALALLLFSAAIVLTATERRPLLRQVLALGAGIIGLAALLGYASDVPSLSGFAAGERMALPTGLALLSLATGVLALQPASGLMVYVTRLSPGARMGVRLLPAVIVVPATLAVLRLAGRRLGLFDGATGLWLQYVATIALFGGVIALYAHRLDQAEQQRQQEFTEHQNRIEQLNSTLEQRVQQRASELGAANHELEAFAYSLAHDLRAPLRAIAGFGAALARLRGDQLGDSGLELLTRMRRASGRMGNLIDAMLLLSELTRRQLAFGPVDMAEIAREVADELRAEDVSRHVEIEIQDGLYVLGDEELLRILMRNLLENAWKFTAACEEPRIAVTRSGPGVFAITDNGAGFNMDFAELLFKPFSRLHREDEFPGSGIGLTTAERIALRHGGALWGEGEPGAGATFYVKLDLLQEALSV